MCPFFLTRILSIPSFFGSKVVADKIYPNFRNLKISCWSAAPLLQIRKERIGQKAELLIIERKKERVLKMPIHSHFPQEIISFLHTMIYLPPSYLPLTLVPPLMANLAKRLHFLTKPSKTNWNCSTTLEKNLFFFLGQIAWCKVSSGILNLENAIWTKRKNKLLCISGKDIFWLFQFFKNSETDVLVRGNVWKF